MNVFIVSLFLVYMLSEWEAWLPDQAPLTWNHIIQNGLVLPAVACSCRPMLASVSISSREETEKTVGWMQITAIIVR